eukprot:359523-Chlamydomonas_euryale.AAC.3
MVKAGGRTGEGAYTVRQRVAAPHVWTRPCAPTLTTHPTPTSVPTATPTEAVCWGARTGLAPRLSDLRLRLLPKVSQS